MGERITRVILEAEITRFEQNMGRAADATKKVKDEGDKLAETHRAMTTLGTTALAMGAAIAAGVGVAVAKYAEFDQAMSFVAATGEDARQNMDALRQAALDAGAETVFSAKESANAIEEMAKAGLSAKEILGGGLSGALDLAAAGGLDVADAAGIAATALKVFNLEGSDMSHVADLLAAGAGKAMGDVTDLSQALAQGGQVAAATGLSIEETTATLAAFASQGLLGSDAGTSFKTMLQRLTPQSAEAKKKMDELGISAYDASGQFIGMEAFAGNLQKALKNLTPEQRNAALSIMFGSDAVRAANVLYSEGEEGIRDWIAAVDDQGYAAETAATRLDNLIGDWEAFTGALDSAMISMGEGVDGPLRGLVQGLTGLVDGFNEIPDSGKQAVLWIGLVTAGVGLVGGAALIAIPKVAAFKVALETLGINAMSARAGLARFASFMTGPWGVALAAAVTTVFALQSAQDALTTSTEEFQNVIKNAKSVDDLFDAADSAVPWLSRLKEATEDAETFRSKLDIIANNDFLRGLDRSTSQLANSLSSLGKELAKTAETDLPSAQKAFKMLADEYDLQDEQLQWLLNTMPEYKRALQEQANGLGINTTTMSEAENAQALLNLAMGEGVSAADDAAGAAKSSADAYLEQADAAAEVTDQLVKLVDQINKANGIAQDAETANANWLAALGGLAGQAEKLGTSLDRATEAGSANRAAMSDVAEAAQNAAAAQYEQDQQTMSAEEATRKYIDTLAAQRQQFVDAAVAAGYNADEVNALADEIFKVPSEKETKMLVETAEASSKLVRFQQAIDALRGKTVEVTTKMTTVNGKSVVDFSGNAAGGVYSGGVKTFAAGGFEPGIYAYAAGGIHKFAEEYAEAYISMDPRRRARSEAVWNTVGEKFNFQQQVTPQVSLEGMQISGTLDLGNGLTGLMTAVVSEAQQATFAPWAGGRR